MRIRIKDITEIKFIPLKPYFDVVKYFDFSGIGNLNGIVDFDTMDINTIEESDLELLRNEYIRRFKKLCKDAHLLERSTIIEKFSANDNEKYIEVEVEWGVHDYDLLTNVKEYYNDIGSEYEDFQNSILNNLKFLGRGSGFNPKEGDTSAFIKEGDHLYLFDCGGTVFGKLLENNILENGLRFVDIFITHTHSDHVGSLGNLILYLYYKLNIKAKVYCFDDRILPLLRINHIEVEMYDYIHLSEYNQYEYIDISLDMSLAYNRTVHGDAIASSFTVRYKNNVFFYSGDSAIKSYDWINNLISQADTEAVFLDSSNGDYPGIHASIDDIYKNIPSEYRQKVWCMHIDCDEVIEKAHRYGFNVVQPI